MLLFSWETWKKTNVTSRHGCWLPSLGHTVYPLPGPLLNQGIVQDIKGVTILWRRCRGQSFIAATKLAVFAISSSNTYWRKYPYPPNTPKSNQHGTFSACHHGIPHAAKRAALPTLPRQLQRSRIRCRRRTLVTSQNCQPRSVDAACHARP